MAEWVRERVKIATSDGNVIRHAEAETLMGIAVHRMPGDQTRWVVTHIKSGKSLASNIRDLRNARDCADEVLAIDADWRLDEGPLRAYANGKDVAEKVAALKLKWEMAL